jgi:hypothetical protein
MDKVMRRQRIAMAHPHLIELALEPSARNGKKQEFQTETPPTDDIVGRPGKNLLRHSVSVGTESFK